MDDSFDILVIVFAAIIFAVAVAILMGFISGISAASGYIRFR